MTTVQPLVYHHWTMNQRLVFVCGPDMCGKTQIAHELANRLDVPYFKASSEHTSYFSRQDRFLNELRFADMRVADLLAQTGYSLVFDRGYPCEWVYSRVMSRQTDLEILRREDDVYAQLGACIVVCYRSSYLGIVDDLDPGITAGTLAALNDEYREFVRTFTKCRVLMLCVDDEDLDREVNEIVKFLQEGNKR